MEVLLIPLGSRRIQIVIIEVGRRWVQIRTTRFDFRELPLKTELPSKRSSPNLQISCFPYLSPFFPHPNLSLKSLVTLSCMVHTLAIEYI